MGRPFAWAIAAGGKASIDRLIEILATELAIRLQRMGISSVAELRAGECNS